MGSLHFALAVMSAFLGEGEDYDYWKDIPERIRGWREEETVTEMGVGGWGEASWGGGI